MKLVIDLEKAAKKPYGHTAYTRRTKSGKLVRVQQKGSKPQPQRALKPLTYSRFEARAVEAMEAVAGRPEFKPISEYVDEAIQRIADDTGELMDVWQDGTDQLRYGEGTVGDVHDVASDMAFGVRERLADMIRLRHYGDMGDEPRAAEDRGADSHYEFEAWLDKPGQFKREWKKWYAGLSAKDRKAVDADMATTMRGGGARRRPVKDLFAAGAWDGGYNSTRLNKLWHAHADKLHAARHEAKGTMLRKLVRKYADAVQAKLVPKLTPGLVDAVRERASYRSAQDAAEKRAAKFYLSLDHDLAKGGPPLGVSTSFHGKHSMYAATHLLAAHKAKRQKKTGAVRAHLKAARAHDQAADAFGAALAHHSRNGHANHPKTGKLYREAFKARKAAFGHSEKAGGLLSWKDAVKHMGAKIKKSDAFLIDLMKAALDVGASPLDTLMKCSEAKRKKKARRDEQTTT